MEPPSWLWETPIQQVPRQLSQAQLNSGPLVGKMLSPHRWTLALEPPRALTTTSRSSEALEQNPVTASRWTDQAMPTSGARRTQPTSRHSHRFRVLKAV